MLPGALTALEASEDRLSIRFRQCSGGQLFAELRAGFGCVFFAIVFLIVTSSRFDGLWALLPVVLCAGIVFAFGWGLWARAPCHEPFISASVRSTPLSCQGNQSLQPATHLPGRSRAERANIVYTTVLEVPASTR